jgi:hypothetical protein
MRLRQRPPALSPQHCWSLLDDGMGLFRDLLQLFQARLPYEPWAKIRTFSI